MKNAVEAIIGTVIGGAILIAGFYACKKVNKTLKEKKESPVVTKLKEELDKQSEELAIVKRQKMILEMNRDQYKQDIDAEIFSEKGKEYDIARFNYYQMCINNLEISKIALESRIAALEVRLEEYGVVFT